MTTFNELNAHNSTIIEWEGKELRTTQDPHIDGQVGEHPYYEASAIDAEGNEYSVIWDVRDEYEEIDDESSMCDWNNPVSVTLVK